MFPGRLLTSLVLASSLILALPRGWCCLFATIVAKAAPVKRSCCSPDGPSKPHTPSQPKPANKYCPCADRNTLLSEHEGPPADEMLYCAWTIDLTTTPLRAHRPVGLSALSLCHFRALQLLNCLWLC